MIRSDPTPKRVALVRPSGAAERTVDQTNDAADSPLSTPSIRPPETKSRAGRSIGLIDAFKLAAGVDNGLGSAKIPPRHYLWLEAIKSARPRLKTQSEAELRASLDAIREALSKGEHLVDSVPSALGILWELMDRTLGIRMFDVQLLATMSLVDGNDWLTSSGEGAVVELDTGEGKTYCVAAAAALRALEGRGCHVTTANGSLARWNKERLEPFFAAAGLGAGLTTEDPEQSVEEKRAAYAQDVTYGTAAAYGFDFMRDWLSMGDEAPIQRERHAVIVDEADDVLIDSATTPLLISRGQESEPSWRARAASVALARELVERLEVGRDLKLIEQRGARVPVLYEAGLDRLSADAAARLGATPEHFSLFDGTHSELVHHVTRALEARFSMQRGRDYVVSKDEIVLVDQGTGHAKPGSRWSDGLHDAVLAKERKPVGPSRQTALEISVQSYFRQYRHLAGITGTAAESAEELSDIFHKGVVVIPRDKKCVRTDHPDRFFVHPAIRDIFVMKEAFDLTDTGRPVLVATVSVRASERLSKRFEQPELLLSDIASSSEALSEIRKQCGDDPRGRAHLLELLERAGVPLAQVLQRGALRHRVVSASTTTDEEAEILNHAGEPGAITIGTQKVGRGIDIQLSDESLRAGGLAVLGVEHQTNGRKDRQMRGRAGRQGAAGSSQFFVSMGDQVFESLSADRVRRLSSRLEGDQVSDVGGSCRKVAERAVREAQKSYEMESLAARKRLVQFDGVIDRQRRAVLLRRNEIKHGTEQLLRELLSSWFSQTFDRELGLRSVAPLSDWEVQRLSPLIVESSSPVAKYVIDELFATLSLGAPPDLKTAGRVRAEVEKRLTELPYSHQMKVLVTREARSRTERRLVESVVAEGRAPDLSTAEVESILDEEVARGTLVPRRIRDEVVGSVGVGPAPDSRPELSVREVLHTVDRARAALPKEHASLLITGAMASLARRFAGRHRLMQRSGQRGSEVLYPTTYIQHVLSTLLGETPVADDAKLLSRSEAMELGVAAFQRRWTASASDDSFLDRARRLILQALDETWMSYVEQIDDLRQGSLLVQYRQANPFSEFAQRASKAFEDVSFTVQERCVASLSMLLT